MQAFLLLPLEHSERLEMQEVRARTCGARGEGRARLAAADDARGKHSRERIVVARVVMKVVDTWW